MITRGYVKYVIAGTPLGSLFDKERAIKRLTREAIIQVEYDDPLDRDLREAEVERRLRGEYPLGEVTIWTVTQE